MASVPMPEWPWVCPCPTTWPSRPAAVRNISVGFGGVDVVVAYVVVAYVVVVGVETVAVIFLLSSATNNSSRKNN